MYWIVDGYNVILSDDKLAKLLRIDNETGRHELLFEIANSRRLSRENVTVIFDGRFAASASRETPNLLVKFSSGGESADDLIKREVGRSGRRRSLTVVTNDRSILAYARECGAKTLASLKFLAIVRQKAQSPNVTALTSEKPESTGRPDPDLLKLFTGKNK